ncbi:hypothetical protein H109_07956 [Trichophyton interdigitale MR816]|uniref:DUF7702 domain-containing protein n=1 Tax=Trichophyton interdigitale (strain MR816) TaxID=1215338 RepID=A0A059IX30_TRIIM|nr:hypothetical protein H101_05604 [Trichophyton interdigitale H6]KDB20094.1 hypothetical protein H109_07956 [Trichophyton interdigitale MR816]
MAVDFRHGIAIFSLIIYLPCFFVAVYVALRHGFAKSAGWYFLVTLSLVRIVGSCLELATIANPTEGLFTGAAVCKSIGISPLILACVGLLQRANNSIINRGQKGIPPILFRGIGLLVLLGLILSIVGITGQEEGAMSYKPNGKSKAAICIILGVWVITVGLVFIINGIKHHLPVGEKRLLLAVAISLPLILIRLIYSLIGTFSHSSRFSIGSGNVTIYLVMAVLEEMVVVITCLAVGVALPSGRVACRGEPVSAEEEMKDYQKARDNGHRQSVPAPYTR